jgi:hypothetical protein
VILMEMKLNNMINIERTWAMPSKNTFTIKPIKELLKGYILPQMISCDPFAGFNSPAVHKNDLNKSTLVEWNLDALDFLKIWPKNTMDSVLYDPPYSPRQVKECYKNLGIAKFDTRQTRADYWKDIKDEITRITRPNGIVISFGWNSNGIGKTRGFELIEVLLVAHGGAHNDTIVTVERKI